MLPSTNFLMCFAGLVYLVAGVLVARKDISAARSWDKLITFGCISLAVSLAVFAPEHFHGGPAYIQSMAPSWMPIRWFWPYLVGCALLAAATSLTLRKSVRLSSTLLACMFSLFVCMIYIPGVFAHRANRFAWTFALRDLSFAGGAWALAGMHSRASSPQPSQWMIRFGRIVVAGAAIFFAVQHFLHPQFAPGVPLEKVSPPWVPLPRLAGYLAGAILMVAGIALAVGKRSRSAAASIGALMSALTLFLYLPILILAYRGSTAEFNEELNYVADTLLYAGTALVLASVLPRDADRVENRASGSPGSQLSNSCPSPRRRRYSW